MTENRPAVFGALLRKEWREQRWRFLIGTVVLSGLLAGLLRAQIVPMTDVAVLIYGPVGLLLVILLATGPVAAERADRTWEFLMAQPVSRAEVLLAKWAVGVLQLVGTVAVATVAGLLAMWSRGFRTMPVAYLVPAQTRFESSADAFRVWCVTHPALSLCVFAAVTTIAMACWFTPLCLLLTRARNEFAAALGGLLLTIALLLWLLQLSLFEMARWPELPLVFKGVANVLGGVALLNPLSQLVLIFGSHVKLLPVVVPVCVVVWIIVPLWYVGRSSSRLIEKWMGP